MIITLTGDNKYLLKQRQELLYSDFVEQNNDVSIEKIDCVEANYEQIQGSLQSMSLLSDKRLVVLNNPSNNKEFVENFDLLIDTISPDVDVLIIEHKPDRRTAFFKSLKSKTKLEDIKELDQLELSKWAVEYVTQLGGKLSSSDANYLIERVGTDQLLLHNELDKLFTYNSKITRENIKLLTEPSPKSTIFELLDFSFNNNPKKALDLYELQRKQKVEPQAILSMISWQLRIIAIVKTAGDRAPSEIAKEAGLHPFVVQKTQKLTAKMKLSEIKNYISKVYELDIRTKSESINIDDSLRQLILSISV